MPRARLSPAERFAALGGTVMVVGLFMHWYTRDGVTRSGWHSVSLLRWLVLLSVLLTAGAAAGRIAGRLDRLPFDPLAVAAAWVPLTACLIVVRWFEHPAPGLSVRIGLFVTLVGAAIAGVGAWQALDEAGAGLGRLADLLPARRPPGSGGNGIAPREGNSRGTSQA